MQQRGLFVSVEEVRGVAQKASQGQRVSNRDTPLGLRPMHTHHFPLSLTPSLHLCLGLISSGRESAMGSRPLLDIDQKPPPVEVYTGVQDI